MDIVTIILVVNLLAILAIFIYILSLKKELSKNENFERFFFELNEKNIKQFEEQREFLHQKIEQIDKKLYLSAKDNQEQIAKNIELFKNIEKSTNDFKNSIESSLSKHFLEFFNSQKEFKDELSNSLKSDFKELNSRVVESLDKISNKVDERLKVGFENVDKTFKDIITGIAKISEAQKKIEDLSQEVVSLQNILSDKKSRGVFGEVQLSSILKSIFGENRKLYDIQYTLVEDGQKVIADAVIKAPDPVGLIAIDSKFPLENFTNMTHASNDIEKKRFETQFKQNLKKHINDISQKYIIKGKTAQMAILFLPAEAIFAEINAYHQDIIEYARKNHIWIASPTTLMALLTTVQAILRDVKTQEQAKKIQEELRKLSRNFKLYKDRWEKLSRHIDTVNKDVKDIHVTTKKISSEFERIENVDFSENRLVE
ncbi:MAG TPA: DNA recombination protein RmuC [Campylobacterales bacterium]|nr:DNA recombination protein RmuC [Campylobacterales bacterium]